MKYKHHANTMISVPDTQSPSKGKYKKNNLWKKMRIAFDSSLLLTLALVTNPSVAENVQANKIIEKKNPNIILIVLDDVGFSDFGAFGSEIKTPNIDALAESGIRYNRFDTSAISAPTRAAIMTGRNNQTVNMEDLPPNNVNAPKKDIPYGSGPTTSGEIPENAQNMAQALKAAGYNTYALGKWHLAPNYKDDEARNQSFWPIQRGFDKFYGFLSGHTSQYKPALIEDNQRIIPPNDPNYHLSTDLINHAIDSIDSNPEKPKFVYLALGAAHSPYHVPKSYIDTYEGKYNQGWDKLRLERFEKQKTLGIIPKNTILPPRGKGDAAWDSLDEDQKKVYSKFMETYAGYITHTDEEIGRLVKHLKETDQYDDTLIILLSDNGAAPEGGVNGGFRQAYMDKTSVKDMLGNLDEAGGPNTDMLYQRPWAYVGATPFNRYKLWPYLGGVRTPLIVSWPSKTKQPNAIRSQYVSVVDIAPTILDAAGTAFASDVEGVKQLPIAGKSFLPTLNSDDAKTRDVQYFQLRGQRAITQGDWRAVALHRYNTSYDDDQWQLFNTADDFSESTDLAKKYPEKLEELKQLWWEEAKKYSNPPVVEPLEFFYKFNRMEDGFKN
ncbi:arylsulfatase [Proteus sp. TJ1640]|uniref:arylsulfatase n=1 Tax=Proteus sp. TJ1640 TaxID=2050968 RepID=UPI000D69950F|nr:arylsulfatase [Proteus sp. TJ1640]